MKVTPVMTGGMPGQNLGSATTERTSPDRLAAAKAVAMGQSPMVMTESDTPTDPQVRRLQETRRKIKMRTQFSPDRVLEETSPENMQIPPAEPTLSATPEDNEPVVSEATKPLSPQFAALAKQRRALQQERQLLDQEKAQLKQSAMDGGSGLTARLKSQPLSVLQELGSLTPEFYNSLTEYLTTGQSGVNPEIQALKEEIKALKEGVDKNFTERDTQAEQQVLSEVRREAEALAMEGETYELVRETRSIPQVIDLIHRTYKKTGEFLDVQEAMQLVEDELLERNLKVANFKKIQAQFQPQQPQMQQQPPQRLIRTLTNRDTAQPPPMDRRTRAMMAALGQKRG